MQEYRIHTATCPSPNLIFYAFYSPCLFPQLCFFSPDLTSGSTSIISCTHSALTFPHLLCKTTLDSHSSLPLRACLSQPADLIPSHFSLYLPHPWQSPAPPAALPLPLSHDRTKGGNQMTNFSPFTWAPSLSCERKLCPPNPSSSLEVCPVLYIQERTLV